jgi:hypothetical protein
MTRMSCPSCDLTVSFKRGESTSGEVCPRCLARSSGTMSVRLHPGIAPKPLGTEARVREFLRKRGLSRAGTA